MTYAYVLAAVLAVLGLFTGFRVRRAAQQRAPLAANFPGQPAGLAAATPYRFRDWCAAAAVVTLLDVVLLLWRPNGPATLVVALAGAFVLLALSHRVRGYGLSVRQAQAAVEAYAPTVAMPYAGKVGVHVGMWAPWITRAGHPWVVVARTPALLRELAEAYPDLPVVAGDIPATVRAAFYPHGSSQNGAFLTDRTATHVFLGHGDSDKPLSASERVLEYDLITVAGQAAIDRFADAGLVVPPDRVRVIGRPQTEGIEVVPVPPAGAATVLYAPTWRHADDAKNLSSLVVGDRVVQALLDRGCTVLFRRHFAGRNHVEAEAMIERIYAMLEQDAAETGRPHVWGESASRDLPLVDAFNAADAMISDVSGIVVDFMASEKPFAMYAAQLPAGPTLEQDFREAAPTAVSAYVVDAGLETLPAVLDAMLGDDPLRPVRHERAAYYLGGDDRADPAGRFVDLVRELGEPRTS